MLLLEKSALVGILSDGRGISKIIGVGGVEGIHKKEQEGGQDPIGWALALQLAQPKEGWDLSDHVVVEMAESAALMVWSFLASISI